MAKYDDDRYYNVQNLHMGTNRVLNTSVVGARVEIDRKTMLNAVTIKDWNIQVLIGATSTGTHNPGRWNIGLSKSLAGTGAVTPFGSAVIGTAADATVADASLTETDLAAGDDLILSYEQGSSLPAGVLRVEADVSYVEEFTG